MVARRVDSCDCPLLETAFVLFSNPVTWLEIWAFVFSLTCVALNVFEIHWAWPFTIVASVLYGWLFYVNKLYGDAALQVLFIIVALWGWWEWVYGKRGAQPLRIAHLARAHWLLIVLGWAIAWLMIGAFLDHFTDTDVPYWDAFPTSGSLIGTFLLARKLLENWPVWIGVNTIAISLFAYKNLILTAILYAVFLLMAIWGWRVWTRQFRRQQITQ